MKDAKGHGSNAHMSGINAIGVLPVHPNVARVIAKNPWGASVKPQTGKVPTSGYMVALPGRTQYVTTTELQGPGAGALLRQFARNNSDVLKEPNAHIGSWADDSGKTHLDVALNIKDRAQAIRTGIKGNQMSIWDNERKKIINTNGSGD